MATTGKLVVIKQKTLQVEFTNAKGKVVRMPIADRQLSARLEDVKSHDIASLEGLEVEFEEVQGQPKNVRTKGDRYALLM
ncbi:MAG: hypothetical protein K2X93_16270 [Candidatus Obscuribacterales bacterium]|nr:hypothetical protein [Candidatus Obscuribacterales bacterium]